MLRSFSNEANEDTETKQTSKSARTDKLRSLVRRYPYLYEHYILDSNSSELGRKAFRRLQVEREKKFELDLLSYAPKLFLKVESPNKSAAIGDRNPTLLNDRELKRSISQFAGRVEGHSTYQDSASQFLNSAKRAGSYSRFKQQMHDYLTSSIGCYNSDYYTKSHFNDWLLEQLRDTLPQNDNLQPSPFLLVKTCAQLIDSLVAAPHPDRPHQHAIFIDLHGNLGASFTIGLLLKLVLLCQLLGYKAKHLLEHMKSRVSKQFAVMFKHYENQSKNELGWLVECLDNLMIAFTIHFGREDFSKWANFLKLEF